jgi:hypothetical protein
MPDLREQITPAVNDLLRRIVNVKTVYKLSGYLSIAAGIMAALGIYRIQWMFYGIAFAIAGFILAGINIFLNSRYYFDQERFPKGYLGMFLSSLPVIFMMLIIFKFRK